MVKYKYPIFENEWEEAIRYDKYKHIDMKTWVDIVGNGYVVNHSDIEHMLHNVDLDFDNLEMDKQIRFNEMFGKTYIEMPIALKINNNHYDLLGGNTRIAGLKKHNEPDIPIWVISY